MNISNEKYSTDDDYGRLTLCSFGCANSPVKVCNRPKHTSECMQHLYCAVFLQ